MHENELATIVLDKCFEIHRQLGPGLFESVYEDILSYELKEEGLIIERQLVLPVVWKQSRLEQGFRIDLKVENSLIVELKSVEEITKVHKKQVFTYIKLSNIRLGLLINFNVDLMKEGIFRIANNLY